MGAQIFADLRRARFRGTEKGVSDAEFTGCGRSDQSIEFGWRSAFTACGKMQSVTDLKGRGVKSRR
jgi:hypothetical protein